jgi:glycosyltransferase involved in cell wall biosynthesis
MRTHVVQLGARMHYAVPRVLNDLGLLGLLLTDFAQPSSWLLRQALAWLTAKRSLRYHSLLPPSKTIRLSPGPAFFHLRAKLLKCPLQVAEANTVSSRALSKIFIKAQARLPASAVYAFDTAAAETFIEAQRLGVKCLLEQCIVPRSAQLKLAKYFADHLGYKSSGETLRALQYLSDRERLEWSLADLIICPSAAVRDAVLEGGVPSRKIVLIPYGVDPPAEVDVHRVVLQRERKPPGTPTTVLFAGSVCLRKGSHTVNLLADTLDPASIQFVVAGCQHAEVRLSSRIRYLGQLDRAELCRQFARADVFFLPSFLEGSATVIYEALGWGLPVVTSHEAGSVVENGVSGFVGRAPDHRFFQSALTSLHENKNTRLTMGQGARRRALHFDLPNYGRRLQRALIETLERTGNARALC